MEFTVNIRFFGFLTELAGAVSDKMVLNDPASISGFREILNERYDGLQGAAYRVAVNEEMADDSRVISSDCEIALFPPFAGG